MMKNKKKAKDKEFHIVAIILLLWTALIFLVLLLWNRNLSAADDTAESEKAETVFANQKYSIETHLEIAHTETTTETETIPETEPETEYPDKAEVTMAKDVMDEIIAENPPVSCKLEDVPYYSQRNLLPTGCEIISAKMVLEYYTQEETDVNDLIENLNVQSPREENGRTYAPHPSQAFIGTPYSSSGFGCFSQAIVRMLNKMLPEEYKAVDTSGTDLQALAETYIPQGTPVLVWATINMQQSVPYLGWYLYDYMGNPTDEWYDWRANEHCLVLIGYDENYYYFNDPNSYYGNTCFKRDIVLKRYEEIGMYSAVVIEADNN